MRAYALVQEVSDLTMRQARSLREEDQPIEANARSLREILDEFGGYEFDITSDPAGIEKYHVDLSQYKGRDINNTFLVIGIRRDYTEAEGLALAQEYPLYPKETSD